MKPDELFKQEDIQTVAERAYQQFIAGMEHMGVKHYEEPVDATTVGTFYNPDEYKKQQLVFAPCLYPIRRQGIPHKLHLYSLHTSNCLYRMHNLNLSG